MSLNTHQPGGGDMEVEVGAVGSFVEGARSLIKAGVRNIAVYLHKGTFYAIDNACYHHGGPLHNGDIEDLGGHPCVICPWHSYRIALDTGEGLYVGLDLAAKKECVKTKGVKQRTHPVIIRDGKVIVQVRTGGPTIESDTYATMAIANQEQATSKPSTATNNLRNIHSKGMGGNTIDEERERAKALLRSKNVSSAVKTLRDHDVPHVQCISKRNVTADKSVVQFVFDKVAGFEPKEVALRPGMWLTLELPVSLRDAQQSVSTDTLATSLLGGRRNSANKFTVQSALNASLKVEANKAEDVLSPDSHLKRTYTIINATSNGRNRQSQGWFSIAVKNMTCPSISNAKKASLHAGGVGSRWIHEHGHKGNINGVGQIFSPELRVVEAGGKFNMTMERTLIARRQGRVLILTGGIGITPAYASICEALQDDFGRTSGPSLHMLHVHVDGSLASVPYLPELLTFRREMASASIHSDPRTYNLQLYLTEQTSIEATMETLKYEISTDVTPMPIPDGVVRSPNALNRPHPVEDPLTKGFGHKTLGVLRTSPSAIDEEVSGMAKENSVVFGRRPTKADVFDSCKQLLGTPTDFVVFLCGPDGMVDEWSNTLVDAGVSPQNIIAERFDF